MRFSATYTRCFMVLSVSTDLYELLMHIIQGCFTGCGIFPNCRWWNTNGYVQQWLIPNHNKIQILIKKINDNKLLIFLELYLCKWILLCNFWIGIHALSKIFVFCFIFNFKKILLHFYFLMSVCSFLIQNFFLISRFQFQSVAGNTDLLSKQYPPNFDWMLSPVEVALQYLGSRCHHWITCRRWQLVVAYDN